MKHFLIKYCFKHGSRAEWHQDIARFISALESDPDLNGKISYRSMKVKGGDDYYHLASAEDERATKTPLPVVKLKFSRWRSSPRQKG